MVLLYGPYVHSRPRLKDVIDDIKSQLDTVGVIVDSNKNRLDKLEKRVEEVKSDLDKGLNDLAKAIEKSDKSVRSLQLSIRDLRAKVKELDERAYYKGKRIPVLIPRFEATTRPEFFTNRTDLNGSTNDKVLRAAQRVRLGAEFHPFDILDAYITLQYVGAWGQDGTELHGSNQFSLYNGYILLHDFGIDGLRIKLGRVQLSLGSGRVIGSDIYSLAGRAFDAGVLEYEHGKTVNLTVLASVVRYLGEPAGKDRNLYGIYYSGQFWRDRIVADAYALYLEDGNPSTKCKIGTFGARFAIDPVEGLSIEAEASIQYGKNYPKSKPSHTQFATAYFAKVQYTYKNAYHPFVNVFFSSASGDANPYDDSDVRYIPLFPSKYPYWGKLDLFDWSGIVDGGIEVGGGFKDKFDASTEFHYYYLASKGGFIPFGPQDRLIQFPAYQGRTVGYEWDIVLKWMPREFLTLEGMYGLFVPGQVTKKAIGHGDLAHGFFARLSVGF